MKRMLLIFLGLFVVGDKLFVIGQVGGIKLNDLPVVICRVLQAIELLFENPSTASVNHCRDLHFEGLVQNIGIVNNKLFPEGVLRGHRLQLIDESVSTGFACCAFLSASKACSVSRSFSVKI